MKSINSNLFHQFPILFFLLATFNVSAQLNSKLITQGNCNVFKSTTEISSGMTTPQGAAVGDLAIDPSGDVFYWDTNSWQKTDDDWEKAQEIKTAKSDLSRRDTIYISSDGKLGIGTSTPEHSLHVKSSKNPIRLEGLKELEDDQTEEDLSILVTDENGIIQKINQGSLSTESAQNTSCPYPNAPLPGVITPQCFGAIADDGICDDTYFNQMFDLLRTERHRVVIPPGKYHICGTIELPGDIEQKSLKIDGYGVELYMKEGGNGVDFTLLSRETPINHVEADLFLNSYQLSIEGLYLKGLASGTGMHINSTLQLEIKNCQFVAFETSLIAQYSMNGRFHGLKFSNGTDKSFVGKNGDWPGGNYASAPFNTNRITECRVHGGVGQSSHYEIIAGDLNIIENCISEGKSPLYNVLIDCKNNGIIKHAISVKNFWIESVGPSTFFELKKLQSYATFENIQAYPPADEGSDIHKDTLLHFASGTTAAMIYIKGYRGKTHLINNIRDDNQNDTGLKGAHYIIENDEPRPTPENVTFPEGNGYVNGDFWVGDKVPKKLTIVCRRSQNTGVVAQSNWIPMILHKRQ